MKRLRKMASINDLTQLVNKYSNEIVIIGEFTQDNEYERGSSPVYYYSDGSGDPGSPEESTTYGDFEFTIDLNKLVDLSGESFYVEDIEGYMESLKTCTNPDKLYEISGVDVYDITEFSKSDSEDESLNEINCKEIKNENGVIFAHFEYTFDGPYHEYDDYDED